MRILMLTTRFPYPPHRGDTVRTWFELAHLARTHDVCLACVDAKPPAAEHLEHVRSLCRDVAVCTRSHLAALTRGGLSWLGGGSLTEGHFRDAGLNRVVANWSQQIEFDAVLSFSTAMAPLAAQVNARHVLDMCDVDSAKWSWRARRATPPLKWLYALEARRLAADERRWSAAADATLLVNQREVDKLRAAATPRAASVLRTAVDIADYALGPPPHEPIVGMAGSLFYEPNVRAVEWFGREVWPRIRTAVPDARWRLVGARPSQRVRRVAREPGVELLSDVPDVRPHLANFRVFANPVRGTLGVQSKLVVALAAGCPIVATREAAEGLDCPEPWPFQVADDPDDFARATIRLLTDDQLAADMSEQARAAAAAHFHYESVMADLERVLAGTDISAAPVDEPIELGGRTS